jgi:hypothetical protein
MSLDDQQLGQELSTMLAERAHQVVGHPAAVSTIARRSRVARRRRRTAAVGTGMVAASALAIVAIRASVGPALIDTATGPTSVAGQAIRRAGAPLRLGLDLPGATVIDAVDLSRQTPTTAQPAPRAPLRDYANSAGTRHFVVTATEWPGPIPPMFDGQDHEMTLSDGTPARLGTPTPNKPVVMFLRGGYLFSVQGVGGVTASDVVAAAGSATVSQSGDEVELTALPPGYSAGPPATIPSVAPDPLGIIDYHLADGTEVSIHVERQPGPQLTEELAAAQTGTLASGVSLETVRGQPALLRRFSTMSEQSTLTWIEPDGTLVWLLVTAPHGATPSPEAIASQLNPIDETTFQRLATDHPPVTHG